MGRGVVLALAVIIGLLVQAPLRVHSQEPVEKQDGLCATFVLSQSSNYACDEYVVQTSDGFILGVQRMYTHPAPESSISKKPVFLYHGILAGGDSWTLNPPQNSLPFLLADAGHDVWIGNTRTTNYSDGHVSFTNSDEAYWDWSLDELAGVDVPTMLNLVSSKTGSTSHYIGFSQGTQAVIAGLSNGQLRSLVDKVVLVAPVVHVNSVKSLLAEAAGLFLVDQLMLLAHIWSFNPNSDIGKRVIKTICSNSGPECYNNFIDAFAGPSCCVNTSRQSYFNDYITQPTAMKNLAHLAQQVRTHTFAKYDYGFLQNFALYHSIYPPAYDVSAIQPLPLLMFHGGTDEFADEDDVNLLVSQLKFKPEVNFLPNYGHLDFLVGTTTNVDVYSKIVAFFAN